MKCFCKSPWIDRKISRQELKGLFGGNHMKQTEMNDLTLEIIDIPNKKLKHKEDKKTKSKSKGNFVTVIQEKYVGREGEKNSFFKHSKLLDLLWKYVTRNFNSQNNH
jgi:hypothetical protein